MSSVSLEATITCSNCEHASVGMMPTDPCRYFREYPACGEIVKPRQGDCCVFCSYGDVACPPVQKDKSCC